MKIKCENIGKRFNRDWIFRYFNYEFTTGGRYAITGPNGSGKSTLLQVIAGAIAASEGQLVHEGYEANDVYKNISIAAPYLDIIEEMNLIEFLRFHQAFKPFLLNISLEKIIDTIGLSAAASKQIRYYSSGMKQRVKLAQAVFSDTSCLLLDEPCSNLDEEGIRLYHQLINDYCQERLIIVSSNDAQEYNFCAKRIEIISYSQSTNSNQ